MEVGIGFELQSGVCNWSHRHGSSIFLLLREQASGGRKLQQSSTVLSPTALNDEADLILAVSPIMPTALA
jgi:hypothetical protein